MKSFFSSKITTLIVSNIFLSCQYFFGLSFVGTMCDLFYLFSLFLNEFFFDNLKIIEKVTSLANQRKTHEMHNSNIFIFSNQFTSSWLRIWYRRKISYQKGERERERVREWAREREREWWISIIKKRTSQIVCLRKKNLLKWKNWCTFSCYFYFTIFFCLLLLAFDSTKTKNKKKRASNDIGKMHFGMHYVIKVDSVLYNFRATE
jgi:hypothetical protein